MEIKPFESYASQEAVKKGKVMYKFSQLLDLDYLAKTAFDAYGDYADWKTFDGRPMPQWEEVGFDVQSRWQASVKAVIDTLSLL